MDRRTKSGDDKRRGRGLIFEVLFEAAREK
jgi:hypothetical protein